MNLGNTALVVACRFCGGQHAGYCHRIKAVEYDTHAATIVDRATGADPSVKRIEFHEPPVVVFSWTTSDQAISETFSGSFEDVMRVRKERLT